MLKSKERRILEHYGKEHQILHTIEELGELSTALSRWLQHETRGENDCSEYYLCVGNVIEEMADVYVMLDQLEMMLKGCEIDIDRIQKEKVERELKRIDQSRKEKG